MTCWSCEGVEEWIGRLRTAVVECKYIEVDRQFKEQFIHGLNDDEMLADGIRGLTNCGEDVTICSETVSAWEKRVEAQQIQTAVIGNLHESRNFDVIKHKEYRLGGKKYASNIVITKKKCKYCGQEHKPG